MHLRGFPALPWISSFPELNLRTYVTRARKPGVFFFSLDAARTVAVMGARAAFHLPYFPATMRVATTRDGAIDYRSRRTGVDRSAELQALYPVLQMPPLPTEPGTTEQALAHGALLLVRGHRAARLHRTEIHHAPWELQPVEAKVLWNTVATAAGIELSLQPALTAYARRLDVVVWCPVRVETAPGPRHPGPSAQP